MEIFLVSNTFVSIKKDETKVGVEIEDTNNFLENFKKSINGFDNFVFVCNDSKSFEENDILANFFKKAFEDVGLVFENVFVLDERNKEKAKDILKNANLVYLHGGTVKDQNKFLKDIDFKNNLNQNACIVGKSAGAMNLSKIVYDYPENDDEVGGKSWYDGAGLVNTTIIPHFNNKNGNDYLSGHFNLLTDYYLPASKKQKLFAIPNGSYIHNKNNQTTAFGECFVLENGQVKKINENNKQKVLDTTNT